ncbi:DUF998 domain-containing protein [Agromyces sp. SYSU T00194]|uniref:DUF998 domain-containing protein n=1 Tax=Agromyces chitinivorans TaxID=3158560 RepID=UPI003392376F
MEPRTASANDAVAARLATRRTRSLLRCGALAGPIFIAVVVIQMATREGFDLSRHPISLLAAGHGGWVQAANFVLAGVLAFTSAFGVARAIPTGPGRRWAPILVGVFGVGLVIGGVFPAGAALGFPPGTPDGIPTEVEFPAVLHAVAPPIAFTAIVIAALVVARRLATEDRRIAAGVTVAIAVIGYALSLPFGPGASIRLFIGIALVFGWLTWWTSSLARSAGEADLSR